MPSWSRVASAQSASWRSGPRLQRSARTAPVAPGRLCALRPPAPAAVGHITGKVTGPDGTTPLAAIRVYAYLQTGPTTWTLAAFADSGADGRYDIGGLATGIYRAKFVDLAGNYAAEYYDNQPDFNLATAFNVTDGVATPNINASLAQAGRITGAVIAASGGAPVADIIVSACQSSGGSCPILGSAVTGTDGKYAIAGLPPGTYRVRFADSQTVPRYIAQYYNGQVDFTLATPVTVTAGQATPNINASMGDYGKITGKVTGPGGTPVLSGIDADIWRCDATPQECTLPENWGWISYGTTDASGNYSAAGLVTGDYRVDFVDPLNQFAEEFYNDKPTLETADNVHVNLSYATANINASLALRTVSLDRNLAIGWNLIAVPLNLTDPAPRNAFASLGENLTLTYAFEGCQPADPWKIFDPVRPDFLNNLTTITVKQGLWLQTAAPATLTSAGAWPVATSINLCAGWNLIGYPSITARSPATALSSIAGKYNLVYGYDAADTADPWEKYDPVFPAGNDLTSMQPWRGYWIRMTQPGTLTIPGR